jgi:PAS domain S-box-containing protein
MLPGLANWLFNPSGLTPHGYCLLWQPGLIWLHAVSNLLIGVAYFSIPITLAALIRRRPDLVFRPVFALAAAFILLCGLGHMMDVLTLWVPAYGMEGLLKAATAAVSLATAVALWRLMPQALALPSPAQLRLVNNDLLAVREAERRLAAAVVEASGARDALAHELARREIAERKMQESDERLQLVLHSQVTEALYLLDAEGRIETWNAAAARIKGYRADEVIGQNFAMFFTPEDAARGVPAAILAQASETGSFTREAMRVRKDGTRFMARVSIDAVRRPDGTLRGFVKVTQDITDRRIQEQQRAIIVESAPNGMIIVDERGIITMANEQVAHIFGYYESELIGQGLEVLIPRDQGDMHELLRSALSEGLGSPARVPQRSFVARKRDGGVATVELMVNTVATPRGHMLVASLFDVSERVREAAAREAAERRERTAAEITNTELDRLTRHLAMARDRAEEASQAKSRFLAAITHELRTPLHGLLGYAELLMLEGGLNALQAKRLETMTAAGQHLLGMVNAVLDMSQIEADRLELHPAVVDLAGLIAVCLNVVRPAAGARGLALADAPMTHDRVVADPVRLRQVVINLLGNAVKFTAAGRIEVRVRAAEGWDGVRVEVADTGPGIRPAHIEKLFTTFERLNANSVAGIEGTGLGLAISARLTGLMGGRIGYTDNPGGGSVFWVELAAYHGGDETAAPATASAHAAAPKRLRVLVADDEILNRSIATSFLDRAGHEVVCVENGAEAAHIAAREDFDVILMDIRMPGMNGMEATRLIRALPGARGHVRVVAVTAQAFAEQIELCQQAGMDAHLSKPFTQAMLLAVLTPAEPAVRHIEAPAPEIPIFDRQMFRETVEFLPPAEVVSHLRTLIDRCNSMVGQLHAPATHAEPKSLIEAVHKLAGATSMFGLLAVGAGSRALERALVNGAPGIAGRLAHLEAELLASVKMLHEELDFIATK